MPASDARTAFLARQLNFLRANGSTPDDATAVLAREVGGEETQRAAALSTTTPQNRILAAMHAHTDALGLSHDEVDTRFLHFVDNMQALKRVASGTLRGTPFYLASIAAIGTFITSILLIFVIPQFEAIFKGFGAELPALTRFVIDWSKAAPLLFILLIGGIAWLALENRAFQRIMRDGAIPDWYSWRFPLMGEVNRRFFDLVHVWLADLGLQAHGTPERALDAAGRVLRDVSQKLTLDGNDRSSLQSDLSLSAKLGTLQRELSFRSDYLVVDLPAMTQEHLRHTTLLLQIAICVIVGIVVIAMYLPIFKLASVI
jgi:type IV pilus assembly protein PilC